MYRRHATRPHPRASELKAELIARFEEAVRLRLISDVPLGAFLSGGVDSSAVVAMMARVGGGRVNTFSIGLSAQEYDETRYARMVAERYATDHRELVVEPDAVAVLPRLVWHYGEPFADPSAVPTYYVAQIARREVTVALNGDGGDERFIGYSRYKAMRYISWLDGMAGGSGAEFGRLFSLAPAILQRRYKIPHPHGITGSPQQPGRRYGHTLASFTDDDKEDCYCGGMREQLGRSALELLESYFEEAGSLVAGANRADIHTCLPDDLMVKVDVASVAHGLEARSPLLDHVLPEWAVSIPDRIKMAHGVTKSLFKSAMKPYLPAELLYRRKMGFSCPVDHWLRNELKELAHDTLLSQQARERSLFRPHYIRRLLDEHCNSVCDHHTRLWALLMLDCGSGCGSTHPQKLGSCVQLPDDGSLRRRY